MKNYKLDFKSIIEAYFSIKTSPNSCVNTTNGIFTNGIRRRACELTTSSIKFFYKKNNSFFNEIIIYDFGRIVQLYSRAYLDITLYKTVMMIGRVVLILYRFEADVC